MSRNRGSLFGFLIKWSIIAAIVVAALSYSGLIQINDSRAQRALDDVSHYFKSVFGGAVDEVKQDIGDSVEKAVSDGVKDAARSAARGAEKAASGVVNDLESGAKKIGNEA